MADEVDVVVLGMGVGGEEVAGRLARAGLSVVGVEHRLVGGECAYWACVPSKMMIRAGNLLAEARRVDGMAGTATVDPDWAPVARRIRAEATDDWDDTVAVKRFTSAGGQFIRGYGRLAGSGRVVVGDRVFLARRGIVISVGSAPAVPPVEGLAGTPYWTNREATEATTVPDTLLVVGGGAVGVELSQVFARFGSAVTVAEHGDRLLSAEEPESSEAVAQALRDDGVAIRTQCSMDRVTHDGQRFTVHLSHGGAWSGDRLLVATGRRANLADLGLDSVGLDMDSSGDGGSRHGGQPPTRRALPTDERLRVGERLWAVGDVTGCGAFTHVAMYQADIVVRDILGEGGSVADYRAVPRVTFTDPEIGAVGLTEARARERRIRVNIGRADLPSSSRGWIHKAGNAGFIKLVVDADTGLLVGATSVGPMGGEVLGALLVAVHARVPVHELRDTIYAYPTFHRAILAAAQDVH